MVKAQVWMSDDGTHMCGEVVIRDLTLRFNSFVELKTILEFWDLTPNHCEIVMLQR